jgi:hypothetical protein
MEMLHTNTNKSMSTTRKCTFNTGSADELTTMYTVNALFLYGDKGGPFCLEKETEPWTWLTTSIHMSLDIHTEVSTDVLVFQMTPHIAICYP